LRRLTVLLFLLAVVPAEASPFRERPFEPRPARGTATCLRSTGTPGGLARFGTLGRTTSTTDLLVAGPNGTTRTAQVGLGRLAGCAAVATAPTGAAIAAGSVVSDVEDFNTEVRAAVRDPGGAFGPPLTLGASDFSDASVVAAVSPAGHAIVAWEQRRGGGDSDSAPFRIVAARRAPGGGFGPVQALTPYRRGDQLGGVQIAAAIDAAGVATVAWVRPNVAGGRPTGDEFAVDTATAAPGAAFARQRIAARALDASAIGLAVAPDGWALLAHGGALRAYERRPGAARFTRALGPFQTSAAAPAVAIRDGGGAVVAWRTGFDAQSGGAAVTTRPGAGPFAAVQDLAPPPTGASGPFGEAILVTVGGYPPDEGNASLRAALGADGRALLAWGARRSSGGGPLIPRVAAGSLAAGFGGPVRLGGPIRDVNGIAPVFLTDGRAAVAWTDNSGASQFEDLIRPGNGRVHLAVEGLPAPPEPTVPRLRVTADRRQRLFETQPVRFDVSCDAACDLRAVMHEGPGFAGAAGRTLLRAGTARIGLGRSSERRRRMRIVVHASAPGGHRTATRTVRVIVIRRPSLPVPRALGVHAVRRGGAIVVRWHTARPARRAFFVVEGRRRRHAGRSPDAVDFTTGRGRTRFALRLRPRHPARVHWVAVIAASIDNGRARRPVLASVP
jgi:hypothetical protein